MQLHIKPLQDVVLYPGQLGHYGIGWVHVLGARKGDGVQLILALKSWGKKTEEISQSLEKDVQNNCWEHP